ncbi:MAG: galactose-1-phosphate uridylyltransferase, partial [bacterium]
MADLRRDPFSGSWTLIAAGRANRPRDHAYPPATPGEPLPGCPFCPGNEDKTPPEIGRTEGGSKGGWLLRAIPNLYPAIEPSSLSDEKTEGLLQSMSGGGRHEVIIDSPDHLRGLADLPDAHSGKVLALLQRRVRELYRIPSVRAVAPFKNHGATAGASLEHSHL